MFSTSGTARANPTRAARGKSAVDLEVGRNLGTCTIHALAVWAFFWAKAERWIYSSLV
jgi:hypothetical protein